MREPNDNGSQFNICVADSSGLNRTYTVFGKVFRGMEVVDKIAAAPRDEFDNPLKPIRISAAKIRGPFPVTKQGGTTLNW